MNTTCQEFTFTKIDDITENMEPGSWFAVVDLKSDYRTIHISPDDRTYQGFVWDVQGESAYFLDNCLCFGLKCAPYLFSRLTDFVIRCMTRRNITGIFGYLDDFLIVANSYEACKEKLQSIIRVLRYLGFSIAWDKVVSPTQDVTSLGIEIDSVAMELRLPPKKLSKLKDLVEVYSHVDQVTRKDLQVLAGHLAHASTVVEGGRTFSRRLINLIKYLSDSTRKVNPEWFYADVNWWSKLMCTFNGSAKIIKSTPFYENSVSTDSSMTGFGGCWGNDWFVGTWDAMLCSGNDIPDHHMSRSPSDYNQNMNINILELWPILVAANRWGPLWAQHKVRIFTDNTQVLHMINTGRSSSIQCMFWIRELFWLSVFHNFHLVASHIGTK